MPAIAYKNLLKEHRLFVLALAATLLVYLQFLAFGHISWDDPEMVFKNKAVKSFDVAALFSNHYVGNYIPVTMLLHALGWLLFGAADWGHHLAGIALHLLNGALVYQLGARLFKQPVMAAAGAIVFLLHPMQVESVGWISELKNVASTSFYLLALLSYARFAGEGKKAAYLFTLLFFVLACLSKSSAVVLPLALFSIDVLLIKRPVKTALLYTAPLLLLSVLFGYINLQTQTADLFINHSHAFAWYQRTGLAGFALARYVILFLLPVKLSVIYPYPPVTTATVVTGWLILLLIAALMYWLVRTKKRDWLFLLLFVGLNLVLVLQFVPFGEVLYADRYLYVPLMGLGWMLGLVLLKTKAPFAGIAVGLIAVLSLLTFARGEKWKSALSLYEDIIKKYPGQFVALNSAGVESMFQDKDAKALEYLNEAVRVAPYNYKGYYNRGLLYIKNNQPQQAIKSFNQSLAIYGYQKAYVGRATAYFMMGDLAKAMSDASSVLRSDPANVKAHFVLGNCYNELNRLDEALREYNRCIALNGEEADYYFKRGVVYGKKREFRQCLNELELSLSLNSELYEAYYWKGVAKVNLKEDPCADFRMAAQKNYQPAVTAYYRYCK